MLIFNWLINIAPYFLLSNFLHYNQKGASKIKKENKKENKM